MIRNEKIWVFNTLHILIYTPIYVSCRIYREIQPIWINSHLIKYSIVYQCSSIKSAWSSTTPTARSVSPNPQCPVPNAKNTHVRTWYFDSKFFTSILNSLRNGPKTRIWTCSVSKYRKLKKNCIRNCRRDRKV